MMLYSESIDVNKTSALKQCIIFFYWTFIKCLSFHPAVCNGCDNVLLISMNLNDTVILTIHIVDYHYIINRISKSEAVNLQ